MGFCILVKNRERWDNQSGLERETERDRETERERQRQRERDRPTDRQTEIEREQVFRQKIERERLSVNYLKVHSIWNR